MEHITLPYANNAEFAVEDLVKYFKAQEINYLIIGASRVALINHRNPNSLDVWLRRNHCPPGYENTCQAVKEVIKQLIKHDQFSRAIRTNPRSGKMCNALVFCCNKKQC
ncbi:hypothetical protein MCEGE10_02835 [Flavobacteriaceae bacterium]